LGWVGGVKFLGRCYVAKENKTRGGGDVWRGSTLLEKSFMAKDKQELNGTNTVISALPHGTAEKKKRNNGRGRKGRPKKSLWPKRRTN